MRIDCDITEMKLEARFYKRYPKHEYLNIYSYCNRWNRSIHYMVAKCNKDNYAHHEDIKRHFFDFETALKYAVDIYKVGGWELSYLAPERRAEK